ncbi:MAG TPA: hypothetical protein VK897_06040 [Anaerolineales bacterium]|nr:hypothetical protein [Anaerolineales bacterium]
MKNNRLSLLLTFSSYAIGVAAGMLLILVAAWGDMESASYGFSRLANAGLRGLRCPVLMTRSETGRIALQVSNTTDSQISPSIRAQISTSSLQPEEFVDHIQVAPGASQTLEWKVDSENIDLGSFIFAKVLFFSAYPIPSQETTCGILVVDLPGSGQVIVSVLVVLSLAGMGGGLYQINRLPALKDWRRKHLGSITFLASMVVLGLVFSFTGGWISTLLVLVITLLTALIIVSTVLAGRVR